MNTEANDAIERFRVAATDYVENPCTGTRYALEMAAVECQLHGVDPSKITPTGMAADS